MIAHRLVLPHKKCARLIERIPKQTLCLDGDEFIIEAHWRVWIDTVDYTLGTYLQLFDDGRVVRVVARADRGDEFELVKPGDSND
jgi:hypothetical protein